MQAAGKPPPAGKSGTAPLPAPYAGIFRELRCALSGIRVSTAQMRREFKTFATNLETHVERTFAIDFRHVGQLQQLYKTNAENRGLIKLLREEVARAQESEEKALQDMEESAAWLAHQRERSQKEAVAREQLRGALASVATTQRQSHESMREQFDQEKARLAEDFALLRRVMVAAEAARAADVRKVQQEASAALEAETAKLLACTEAANDAARCLQARLDAMQSALEAAQKRAEGAEASAQAAKAHSARADRLNQELLAKLAQSESRLRALERRSGPVCVQPAPAAAAPLAAAASSPSASKASVPVGTQTTLTVPPGNKRLVIASPALAPRSPLRSSSAPGKAPPLVAMDAAGPPLKSPNFRPATPPAPARGRRHPGCPSFCPAGRFFAGSGAPARSAPFSRFEFFPPADEHATMYPCAPRVHPLHAPRARPGGASARGRSSARTRGRSRAPGAGGGATKEQPKARPALSPEILAACDREAVPLPRPPRAPPCAPDPIAASCVAIAAAGAEKPKPWARSGRPCGCSGCIAPSGPCSIAPVFLALERERERRKSKRGAPRAASAEPKRSRTLA
eukprot:tig00000743_g3863.t1